MNDAVVIISGGMDSTVLAAYVKDLLPPDGLVHGLSFNYGQRHFKELGYARRNETLSSWTEVNLQNLNPLLQGSSLTSPDIEVPDGHYAAETMKQTVVPNRNMIMLSIAVGYAVSKQSSFGVWTGVHAGDHFIYPDCRPEFIKAASKAASVGNEGFWDTVGKLQAINAPFSEMTKAQIVELGTQLEVNFAQTWSCYKGGMIHCGRCGTCVERKEAFAIAGVPDPTPYEDPIFEVAAFHG